jgi:hypothetical protein
MRKLTLADIRLSEIDNIIAAPMWAFKYKYGYHEPVKWVWADVSAELKRRHEANPNKRQYPWPNRPHTVSCVHGGQPKTCLVCGKEFMATQIKHQPAVCTEKCYRERRRQTHKQSKQPRPHVSHDLRRCAQCGEPFRPLRSDARFCSLRCRVAHHRLKPR